jgi:hypothetical protein
LFETGRRVFGNRFDGKKLSRKRGNETLKSDIEDQADVPDGGASQVFENGDEIEQLVVVGIREPTADGDGVLRVENVRGRRVVDDDGVLQVAAHLRQVLDVVALVVVAALPEQPVVDNLVDVQLIEERVAILSSELALHRFPGVKSIGLPWIPTP